MIQLKLIIITEGDELLFSLGKEEAERDKTRSIPLAALINANSPSSKRTIDSVPILDIDNELDINY